MMMRPLCNAYTGSVYRRKGLSIRYITGTSSSTHANTRVDDSLFTRQSSPAPKVKSALPQLKLRVVDTSISTKTPADNEKKHNFAGAQPTTGSEKRGNISTYFPKFNQMTSSRKTFLNKTFQTPRNTPLGAKMNRNTETFRPRTSVQAAAPAVKKAPETKKKAPEANKKKTRKEGALDYIHSSSEDMLNALKYIRETVHKCSSTGKIKVEDFQKLPDVSQSLSVLACDLRKVAKKIDPSSIQQVNQQEFLRGDCLMEIIEGLGLSYEDCTSAALVVKRIDPDSFQPRPPIVSVMGHVDAGKTTLLDYFRKQKEKIAPNEIGGITQSIGSFQVNYGIDGESRPFTFFDTPGHSVFTAMRETIARVSDVVVVVIDVNEGVQQQTREVFKLLSIYSVPMVIAITKCDNGEADVRDIFQQLRMEDIDLEVDGGDVQVIQISAKTGNGISNLFEAVALTSDIVEPTASKEADAELIVVETQFQKGLGHLVHAVVTNGELRAGDYVQGQNVSGYVNSMFDQYKKSIKVAPASTPVTIKGLDELPQVGETLVCAERNNDFLKSLVESSKFVEKEDIGDGKIINLVVKTDQSGTLSSVTEYVSRLPKKDVYFNIVKGCVGDVSADDVKIAESSSATILCYNVAQTPETKKMLKDNRYQDVRVIKSKLIYELCDEINKLFLENVSDDVEMVVSGEAKVLAKFSIDLKDIGAHNIAGCRVENGNVFHEDGSRIQVIRKGKVICESESVLSLRIQKESVDSVEEGEECGIALKEFQEFEKGDVLRCLRAKKNKMDSGELFRFVDECRNKELEVRRLDG